MTWRGTSGGEVVVMVLVGCETVDVAGYAMSGWLGRAVRRIHGLPKTTAANGVAPDRTSGRTFGLQPPRGAETCTCSKGDGF